MVAKRLLLNPRLGSRRASGNWPPSKPGRVDEAALRKVGLVNGRGDGVKILARGKLEKKLTVCAAAFSASAKAAIEEKGGTCEPAAKSGATSSDK